MTASSDPTSLRIADALARLTRREHGGRGGHHHGPHHGVDGADGVGRGGGRGPRGHGRPSREEFVRSRGTARFLEVLGRSDTALTVGRIAEEMGVDQPRASKLVQAVVADGLAQRESDPEDARRTLISLTASGREQAERLTAARTEAVDTALAGFSDEEREQFAALLGRFAQAWPAPGRRR